jgi:hypothetical protein
VATLKRLPRVRGPVPAGGGDEIAALYLPDTAGNYITTPLTTAMNFTTQEIDVTAHIKPESTGSGTGWPYGTIVARRTTTDEWTSPGTFWFGIGEGYVVLYVRLIIPSYATLWIPYSMSYLSKYPTIADQPRNGFWLRATFVAYDDDKQSVARFYISEDGVEFTELPNSPLADIFDYDYTVTFSATNAAVYEIGSYAVGTDMRFKGQILSVSVRDGIDGRLIMDADLTHQSSSPRSPYPLMPFDSVGNPWRILGNAWEYRDLDGNTVATARQVRNGSVLLPRDSSSVRGDYFSGNQGTQGTSISWSNGQLYLVPLWLTAPVVIDRIGVAVTVGGSTGSVIRLGAFMAEENGVPRLLFDAGTVASTGTGLLTATIEQTLPAGLVYLACAFQGAPGTQPTIRVTTGGRHPLLSMTAANIGTNLGAKFQASVTGAFSSTYNPASVSDTQPLVVVRAKA